MTEKPLPLGTHARVAAAFVRMALDPDGPQIPIQEARRWLDVLEMSATAGAQLMEVAKTLANEAPNESTTDDHRIRYVDFTRHK